MNIYEEVSEEKYIDKPTQQSAVLYERNDIQLFFLNLIYNKGLRELQDRSPEFWISDLCLNL